jgi:hypothetical protein
MGSLHADEKFPLQVLLYVHYDQNNFSTKNTKV